MKVLKFGGSSVANAINIRQAGKIISGNDPAQKQLVVVSALGGITDQLISIGTLASAGDEGYKQVLETIETRAPGYCQGIITRHQPEQLPEHDQTILQRA